MIAGWRSSLIDLHLRLHHCAIDLLDDDEQDADRDDSRHACDHGGDGENRDDGDDRPDDWDQLGERQRGGEQQRVLADIGVDEDAEQVEPDHEWHEDDPRDERRAARPGAEDVAQDLQDSEDATRGMSPGRPRAGRSAAPGCPTARRR